MLLGYLSDTSSHYGDKLDCFLASYSFSFNCDWWKLVSLAIPWYFAVLFSADRFAAADAVVAVLLLCLLC